MERRATYMDVAGCEQSCKIANQIMVSANLLRLGEGLVFAVLTLYEISKVAAPGPFYESFSGEKSKRKTDKGFDWDGDHHCNKLEDESGICFHQWDAEVIEWEQLWIEFLV
ncbi:hypothetical protein NE237_004206 [Protea cynaroides]|uniref:Uncharacterized protein n=1 Tax=Protea cynaroides TaxID=273540 RepID=A0A9Q0KIC5_9MAGN|nr:hypothetical protein NE237_004206 [Protea cynaroides]